MNAEKKNAEKKMYIRDLHVRINWKLHRLRLSCGIPMDISL